MPAQSELLDSKLASEGPLQHRREERGKGGGGHCLVAAEGAGFHLALSLNTSLISCRTSARHISFDSINSGACL